MIAIMSRPPAPDPFAAWPPGLIELATRRAFQPGQTLFTRGRAPTQVFWVEAGEVCLQRVARGGQPLLLQRVHQGFVAEASLQAARYHCDAVAARASTVWGFPRARLLEAMRESPQLALWWASRLAEQLRVARLRCERLSLKGAGERIVHAIETEGAGGVLVLAGTRRQWAEELALTPEALYRSLARLRREGWLRVRGGELRLVAPPTRGRAARSPAPA